MASTIPITSDKNDMEIQQWKNVKLGCAEQRDSDEGDGIDGCPDAIVISTALLVSMLYR